MSDVSVRDRRSTAREEAEGRALGLNVGWTVFSYLLSGMAAYGAIGWLIGRGLHVQMLFPIGMLAGLAISLGFVIWRYGTNASAVDAKDAKDGKDAKDSKDGKDTETGVTAAAGRASHRRGSPREEKSR